MTGFVIPFTLNAVFIDAHDGDTLKCVIDRGFYEYWGTPEHPYSVRLARCAARELSDPGGPEARDNLRSMFTVGEPLGLYTVKQYKFSGALVADVMFIEDNLVYSLTKRLVEQGWAAFWDGKGKQPKPPWPRVT